MKEKKGDGFLIKPEQRQSWGSLAMIWIGSMICVPCLMIGGLLGSGLTLPSVILCIIIGYVIVCVYMCFMGMQGCDTGLPTVRVAAGALGEKGSQFIISLLLAIACIGWFGIQSAVCGASFASMINSWTGAAIPTWSMSILWGAIMLITAMFGYKALKYLNYIAVPALVIVCVYGVISAMTQYDGANVLAAYSPAAPMSIVSGISLVVATFALGGVISGDYSRFAKNRAGVIKSSVIGVLPAGLAMLTMGAVMSIVTGQYDITAVLSAVGVPAVGLIALVLATWTTNVTNAYSGGLAVANLIGADESKFKLTTGIAGALGIILSLVIMEQMNVFLNVLSAFIPPVAGVIIAHYWIRGKGKPENFHYSKGVSPAGVIAFAVGAFIAYMTANVAGWIFFVGPINGILVSLVLYILLSKVWPPKPVEAAEETAEEE